MNHNLYCTKPVRLGTFEILLPTLNPLSGKDIFLDDWVFDAYSEDNQRAAVYNWLKQLGVIEFNCYCSEWFERLSLGYNSEREIGKDDCGEQIFQNSIKLTALGVLYLTIFIVPLIKSTYENT